jgi:hypothetical protein
MAALVVGGLQTPRPSARFAPGLDCPQRGLDRAGKTTWTSLLPFFLPSVSSTTSHRTTAQPWGGGRRERPLRTQALATTRCQDCRSDATSSTECPRVPWSTSHHEQTWAEPLLDLVVVEPDWNDTISAPLPELDPYFRTAAICAACPNFHGSGRHHEPNPSSSAVGAHSRREQAGPRMGRRPIEGREDRCAAASGTHRFAASPPATPGGELRRPHMEREAQLRWEARWRWEGGQAGRGSSTRWRGAARWSQRSSPGPAEHASLPPCHRARWRLGKE